MENKRRGKRRSLIYYLKVLDQQSGILLGHIADITAEGFLLITDKLTEKGKVYHVRIILPDEIDGKTEILVDAQCMRAERDVNPDFYAIGFMMPSVSVDDATIIYRLIKEYAFTN